MKYTITKLAKAQPKAKDLWTGGHKFHSITCTSGRGKGANPKK